MGRVKGSREGAGNRRERKRLSENPYPAWQAQKRVGGGGGRKARKREKGKAEPTIRAGVFVFHLPFSELIR